MKRFKSIFIVIVLSLCCFAFTGCEIINIGDDFGNINGNTNINVDTSIKSISVVSENNQFNVNIGSTLKLTATVNPTTSNQQVTWTSTNTQIATVSNDGVVTGVRDGKTIIVVKSVANETIVKSVTVTVLRSLTEATAIEINGTSEMYVNSNYRFTITTTPVDAKNDVVWTVDNEELATITSDGTLTALKAGKVKITATYSDTIKDEFELTINEREINPERVTASGYKKIYVNEVSTLQVHIFPENAKNEVTFISSNSDVATVDTYGRVKGIKEGEAVITITCVSNTTLKYDFKVTVLASVNIENNDQNSLQTQVKNVINYNNKSVFGVINYALENGEYVKSSIGSGFVYKSWAILKNGDRVDNPETITDLNTVNKYCYYLLTNRHVVEDAQKLTIYIGEFDKYIDATLMQYDDKVDVSVVYFEYYDYIRPLVLGDSSKVERGDFVIAMGNPYSLDFYDSATFGMVSNSGVFNSTDTDNDNVNDWDQEYIQHDAAINPGNSGGPLFNLKGEVIGINTMKFAATDIDNMGFSITTNSFKGLLSLLEKGEKPTRPLLGVTVVEMKNAENGKLAVSQTLSYEVPNGINSGLFITEVKEDSVAANATLKAGDIIVCIGEDEVKEGPDVRLALGKYIVGSGVKAKIGVYRLIDETNKVWTYMELEVIF